MLKVILLIQLITIATGFLCLRKERPVVLCLALGITILAVVNEHIFISILNKSWKLPRNVFYNIFSIVDIICWSFIFFFLFEKRQKIQYLVIGSGITVLLYTMLELFISGSLKQFHSNSFMCFNAMNTMLSVVYFLTMPKRTIHIVWHDHTSWLCAAAFIFNGMFLINLLGLIDSNYWSQPAALHTFYVVQYTALIIYHLLLCISFYTIYYRYRPVVTRSL